MEVLLSRSSSAFRPGTTRFGILLLLLLWAAAIAAPAPVRALVTLIDEPGGDFRIDTITGVNIDGAVYDATFVHGVSFQGPPVIPITFGTEAGARTASFALIAMLDAAALSPTTDVWTVAFSIPFLPVSGGTVPRISARSSSGFPLVWTQNAAPPSSIATAFVIATTSAYVSFTAVPEPGLLALWSVAGAVGLVWRRRVRVGVGGLRPQERSR